VLAGEKVNEKRKERRKTKSKTNRERRRGRRGRWGGYYAKLSEIDLGCVDLIDLFRVGSKDQSLH
jgi:hypothetical protein